MKLPSRNKYIKIFSTIAVTLLVGMLIVFFLKKEKNLNSSMSFSIDLNNHAIYSQYKFSSSDSVINIGIQPMYVPAGIICEIIKRDKIFNNTLSSKKKEIKYYSFHKGADVNYFLQKGKLNGGVGGDMPAISASSNLDVFVPVLVQKGNVSIISKETILTNNLRNKRIAYPYGSVSHYFILDLLQSEELTQQDVKLVPMDISLMADALNKNKIDLFSVWEPNVTSALKKYPEFLVTYKRISTGYFYFSKSFVNANPEIVEHLLAAVIRSITWMKNDRENLLLACKWNIAEIEKITGEKSILTPDEMADVALKDILRYHSNFSLVISNEELETGALLHKEFEFLKSVDIKLKDINWNQLKESFDNKIITNVLLHSKEFRLNEYNYELI